MEPVLHGASPAKLIHVVAQVGDLGDTEYREYPRASTLYDLTVQTMLFPRISHLAPVTFALADRGNALRGGS